MRNGIRDALLAALLFGLSTPIAKGLLGSLPPQFLAGLLYLGSGLGLTALRAIRRTAGVASPKLSSSDIPFLLGAIVSGGVVAPVLLMYGLQATPASSASLLLNLEAVFTALIAWAVFHENISSRIAAGLVAIVAGGAILSWKGSPEFAGFTGHIAIAAACLCWGIDNNLTQKLSGGDAVRIAGLKGLAAGTVNVALAWALGQSRWFGPVIIGAIALGFVAYGLSLVLYIRGLRELGTARAGNYFSIAPFVGAVAGVILWKEPLSPTLLLAGLLMGIGIWLHITERHEHWHVHEEMTHEHMHTHEEHHQHPHSEKDPKGEPHSHVHRHDPMEHSHPHYPDIHHRHPH